MISNAAGSMPRGALAASGGVAGAAGAAGAAGMGGGVAGSARGIIGCGSVQVVTQCSVAAPARVVASIVKART
jgi:hypothetical protein